jgi:hypothetical protein
MNHELSKQSDVLDFRESEINDQEDEICKQSNELTKRENIADAREIEIEANEKKIKNRLAVLDQREIESNKTRDAIMEKVNRFVANHNHKINDRNVTDSCISDSCIADRALTTDISTRVNTIAFDLLLNMQMLDDKARDANILSLD